MNTAYRRPRTVTTLRVFGLLSLAVVVVQIIASIASGRRQDLGGDFALGAGFCFWISAAWLDYTARAAYHAERSADSLLRMEWAAKESAAQRQQWEEAQRAAQGDT